MRSDLCVDQSFAVRKDGELNMLSDRGRICAVMWVFPLSNGTSYAPANTQAECIEVATRSYTQRTPGGHRCYKSMQSRSVPQKVSVEWTVHIVRRNMVSLGLPLSLRFGRLITENVVNTGKYETTRFVKRCI